MPLGDSLVFPIFMLDFSILVTGNHIVDMVFRRTVHTVKGTCALYLIEIQSDSQF